MAAKVKIKKGDRVQVIAGKDKGKSQAMSCWFCRKENRAVVSGINVAKRHQRQTAQDQGWHRQQGNADPYLEPGCAGPERITSRRGSASRVLEDGRKVRVAKRSAEVIDG